MDLCSNSYPVLPEHLFLLKRWLKILNWVTFSALSGEGLKLLIDLPLIPRKKLYLSISPQFRPHTGRALRNEKKSNSPRLKFHLKIHFTHPSYTFNGTKPSTGWISRIIFLPLCFKLWPLKKMPENTIDSKLKQLKSWAWRDSEESPTEFVDLSHQIL